MKQPGLPSPPPPAANAAELLDFGAQPELRPMMHELYRRAEVQMRRQQQHERAEAKLSPTAADPQRMLHELQVHQIELELQNDELQKTRDEMETWLGQYSDLYDFAPVGYFTLTPESIIRQVNLTGATLVGIERSRLVGQPFSRLVAAKSGPVFNAFIKQVFANRTKQASEFALLRRGRPPLFVNVEAQRTANRQECRAAVMDITERKRLETVARNVEVLATSNRKLEAELARRLAKEKSLKQSALLKSRLLEQSRAMQEQLRHLSRQVLHAQEEERKRISRELHDVIAQTLTGINIQLAALKKEAALNREGFDHSITRTQKLVEHSVHIVHEFARELRPAVLDDLGLIPALHSFVKIFSKRTKLHVDLKAFAGVEKLDNNKRTILYRVAQEALNNVARHAQASRVEVSIQKSRGGIRLKISDDGKSFNVARALPANGGKRLGLVGMRERVEMVGGKFTVASAPGQGTTIEAHLPLTKGKRV